ncbi:MAG: M56 family metallopeptidase, partial [Sphingomonadales bacterium]|jgi:beta-lactamase regulating signal transducer with metallopeptidase domain
LKSKKSEEPVMTLPSPTQPVAFEGRYERAKLLPLGDALLSKRKQESVVLLDAQPQKTDVWLPLLLSIWAIGVGIFAGQYIRSWFGYAAAVQQAFRPVNPQTEAMLDYWRSAMGVRRKVRLVAGANHISPFTMGLLRPVIFVPKSLVEPGRERALDAAMGHEMAHIRRLDDLWIKFEAAIKIAYFFFPIVWWVGARIEAAREEACDALALHRGRREAKTYATGLLTALKLCAEPRTVAPCPGLTHAMGGLRQRLLNLKSKKESPMATIRSLAIIALVGGCTLPLAQAADSPQDVDDVNDAFAQAESPTLPPAPPQPPVPGFENDMAFADVVAGQEFAAAMQRFNAQMATIPLAEIHPKHVFGKKETKHLVRDFEREIAHLKREGLHDVRAFDQETRALNSELRELGREVQERERDLREMHEEMREAEQEMRMEMQFELDPEEQAEMRAEIEEELREAQEEIQLAEEALRQTQEAMRVAEEELRVQMETRMVDREFLIEQHQKAMELAMQVMEDVRVDIDTIMESEDLENLETRVEEAIELAHEKARKAMEDAMQSVEENKEKDQK